MKQIAALIAALIVSLTTFAQGETKHLFTIDDTPIGGYIGVNGRYATVESNSAGILDGKIVAVIDGDWGVGFSFSVLNYDRTLGRVVNDGTYRMNAGYAGIYVERIFKLGDDFRLSASITSGMGEVFYQYDKEYRKEKVWSEEIIDRTTFAVFEPAIEIDYNIGGNYWIGIMGAFRNTSPVELIGLDENVFQKFTGGITFKYGLF